MNEALEIRPAVRQLPRVIAVANQKGGVGKTTTTINTGACLAEMGLRTLIVDLDPQGNATTGLGIENRGLETSMYHVLMHDVPLENCIEPTDVRNLFVAPASLDLAGAEIELVPAFSRETRLKRAIDAVIGADVAARLGYKLGDPIVIAHGLGAVSFLEHDDKPFRVVGILEKTGTPVDRTVHVSLAAIEAIHVDWQSGSRIPGQSVPAEEVRRMDLTPKAVTAALEDVRKHPADAAKRTFLAELLCFTGDLERADKQLDVIASPEKPELMGALLFRQLIRAETR